MHNNFRSKTEFSYLNETAVRFLLERTKTFLNEQRSRDAAAKKKANTSGVGTSNNYYEEIYIQSNLGIKDTQGTETNCPYFTGVLNSQVHSLLCNIHVQSNLYLRTLEKNGHL